MATPGDLLLKDPQSDEPEGFDWTSWLLDLAPTATIVTSAWTITGKDAALTAHDPSIAAGLTTQASFVGGTLGRTYTVTNRITTNTLPVATDERSFQYLVENR